MIFASTGFWAKIWDNRWHRSNLGFSVDQISQFVGRHSLLVIAFVVMLLIIAVYEYIMLKKQGKTISTAQAIEQINHFSATVIDLRAAELFKKGHIIGAIRASTADFKLPKIQQYKEKPVILVCTRGVEAQAAGALLRAEGFTHVMVLSGGITAWQAANLPVVKK